MSTGAAPLAIALGDPAGIGPEIILGAFLRLKASGALPPLFVVGGAQVLSAAAERTGIDCPLVPIADPAEALFACAAGLPVMAGLEAPYTPGAPGSEGARLALASLSWATRFALGGVAAGVVTAPVAKSALAAIGFDYPGQTEFLADACGLPYRDAVMMLAGPSVRAVPLTVHVALAEVPALLSADLITHKARIVAAALSRDFGIAAPASRLPRSIPMRARTASSAMKSSASSRLPSRPCAPKGWMRSAPSPAMRCSPRARAPDMTPRSPCITIRR